MTVVRDYILTNDYKICVNEYQHLTYEGAVNCCAVMREVRKNQFDKGKIKEYCVEIKN